MFHDESAAAMVEYGILIACIALVALTAVEAFGQSVSALFSSVPSHP
jgi:Flp pilus assembly pilin Flp